MPRDWVIAAPAPGRDALAAALRISPVVAQVLCNRGISDEAGARKFLKPAASDLFAPERLPGAMAAAGRIVRAIRDKKKIVIYGDYDVDGVTGTAILWHAIRLAGGAAEFYIPRRLEEGYGLNVAAIESLAAEGAELIVSVDCGVTAVEAAARARELGVELIITDHHQPQVDETGAAGLPDALIVHPGLASLVADGSAVYENPNLSGAGVALKVAWAIGQVCGGRAKVSPAFREFLVDAMALAALGTVADVVPLLGENRLIAANGLLGLRACKLPGVRALIASSGLGGQAISGYDIGFKLGPRLNAIGRMGHARLAVDLFTRADDALAAEIAANLEQQNRARQSMERKITAQAKEMVVAQKQDADAVRAVVLASEGWHAGVIGIVAARIADTFSRPAVMIAVDNGTGQGSARSVRNFSLVEALADCRGHLLSFGGHAMAAGLKIATEKIGAFREAFQARAAQALTHSDLTPRLHLDDEVRLDQLDESLVADLGRLEPLGAGNPAPKLATGWLDVVGEPRLVGSGERHMQVTVSDGRRACKAIAFGMAEFRPMLLDHRRCRIAFKPTLNEWNGRRSVEMQVVDFQFPS